MTEIEDTSEDGVETQCNGNYIESTEVNLANTPSYEGHGA